MSLPRLAITEYECTLPASKKTVKFRPFVVKESKVLLLALEEGNTKNILNAIGNMIDACTFGVCDIKKMPQVDVEYLFVQVRNKSLGEGLELVVNCTECKHPNIVGANLDAITVSYPENVVSNEIQLTASDWVIMHHPSLENSYDIDDSSTDKDVLLVIAECIETIVSGEQTYEAKNFSKAELVEWVQNLNDLQKKKIEEFFASVPTMRYSGEFKCVKCQADCKYEIEGLSDFFD